MTKINSPPWNILYQLGLPFPSALPNAAGISMPDGNSHAIQKDHIEKPFETLGFRERSHDCMVCNAACATSPRFSSPNGGVLAIALF
jgi:hypothetical protein